VIPWRMAEISEHQQSVAPVRRVGILLFFGILVFPIFFVWLLLRRGHTQTSRVIGFGWLIVFIAIGVLSGRADQNAPAPVATTKSIQPVQAAAVTAPQDPTPVSAPAADAPAAVKEDTTTYDPSRAQKADVDAVWQSTLDGLALSTKECIDGYAPQIMRGYAIAHQPIDKATIVQSTINRCAPGYIQNAAVHHYKSKEVTEAEVSTWASLAYENELAKGR
jgi:hypothetical protein